MPSATSTTPRSRVSPASAAELMKLRETCVRHKTDLEQVRGENPGGRTLIERIDRLLSIRAQTPEPVRRLRTLTLFVTKERKGRPSFVFTSTCTSRSPGVPPMPGGKYAQERLAPTRLASSSCSTSRTR